MKRVMSLAAVIGLLLCVIPWSTASAASGDFSYEMLEDGTVEITAYNGTATELVVPAAVDGLEVSALGAWALFSAPQLQSVSFEAPIALRPASMANPTLREVTLPKGLQEIGDDVFHTCPKLEELEIPQGVTTIGASVFEDCTSLKRVIMPNSVTSIGSGAFSGCTALNEIRWSTALTQIGPGILSGTAYYNNEENWEDGVLYADGYLLDVDKMTAEEYAVESGTKCIAQSAFFRCSTLKTVRIPATVKHVGAGAFTDCTALQAIKVDGGNSHYSDIDGVMFNEDQTRLHTYPAAKAGDTYVIPSGVTTIEESAFRNCQFLTSMHVPECVTAIGRGAFENCDALESVTIQATIASIPQDMFNNCGALTSVSFPQGLTHIAWNAFFACKALYDISIPDSVTEIGSHAFEGTAYYADESMWQEDVLYLDGHLIAAKRTLSGHYTVKKDTKSIGGSAFWGCRSLESVSIPNSVKVIGERAFSSCSALECAVLPSSLKTLRSYTFDNCTALSTVVLPSTLERVETYAFLQCRALEELELPDSLTCIEEEAFAYCTSLKRVVIPDGAERIEGKAFVGCAALESVVIPRNTKTIAVGMFFGCEALRDVYFGGNAYEWKRVDIEGGNTPLMQATVHYAVTVVMGDVSGDDDLNMMDALLLFGGINGARELTQEQQALADLNADGRCNMMDALRLFALVSGE